MRKTIFLMRHAEAGSASQDGDKGRKLTLAGQSQAAQVGSMLSHQYGQPDAVICSPSTRTRETLEHMGLVCFDATVDEQYPDELYNAEAEVILWFIQQLPDHVDSVLIIAHNPGIMQAALGLWDRQNFPDSAAEEKIATSYPPSYCTVLGVKDGVSWDAVKANSCTFDDLIKGTQLQDIA